MEVKRGDIFFANLGECNTGSEQAGTRPVLVVQNDIGNRFSPTVIIACITSKIFKNQIPTHVRLHAQNYQNIEDSLVLCEQIKTIDKTRLTTHLATLNAYDMAKVGAALRLSLHLH